MSATPAPGQPATVPPLTVNAQYVKDLSFEVPGAPQIYSTLRSPPQVNINLDVQVRRLVEGQQTFEVTLSVRAEAFDSQAPANMPKQAVFIAVEPVLLVECPRILVPFARNVLADVTREGGFPPVLLQPIDFVSLWHARRAQQSDGTLTA